MYRRFISRAVSFRVDPGDIHFLVFALTLFRRGTSIKQMQWLIRSLGNLSPKNQLRDFLLDVTTVTSVSVSPEARLRLICSKILSFLSFSRTQFPGASATVDGAPPSRRRVPDLSRPRKIGVFGPSSAPPLLSPRALPWEPRGLWLLSHPRGCLSAALPPPRVPRVRA